jgi:hypothetical protein
MDQLGQLLQVLILQDIYVGFSGTQTAALVIWWKYHVFTSASESWNGSSWTATPTLNTARCNLGGAGTQTAALAFGGDCIQQNHQQQNHLMDQVGLQLHNLNTARAAIAGCGIQTAALAFGG